MDAKELSCWNDGTARSAIIDLVRDVTDQSGPDYLPPEDRIAVFDNDGTLWCEYPLQVQLYYFLERFSELLKSRPELAEVQPYKAIAARDIKTLLSFDKQQIMNAVFTASGETTPEEYATAVRDWFNSAAHPELKRSFYDVAYRPQTELLNYLSANGFKTFIVSGGGIEFIRVISEKIYSIPTYMVIGSTGKTEVVTDDAGPMVKRIPGLRDFNDKDEKVININYCIGKRPVLAFGNSDGDRAMLRYTKAGKGRSLSLLLHHDDGEREFAYDRDFKISTLSAALDNADADGTLVVSMKNDWNEIF
ncbi:MAG: haloacid dehalogenase-like hydrolase [Ignavibacteria bacterium]|nr:haloacid dehalogenase-like hydrolase [Ignavibacteria bacterium]